MGIVTVLSLALCGSIAELPSSHCEDVTSWEYVAETAKESDKDWERCMARREELKLRLADPDVEVNCDQFIDKREVAAEPASYTKVNF